jgi:hypothetical protein
VSHDTEVKGLEKKTIANTAENRRAALHKPPRRGAEPEDGEKIKEMKQDGVGGGEEKGEKEKDRNPRSRPATPRLKKQKKPAQDSPSM